MRAYFYPETGFIWFTYIGPEEKAPTGDFIEVAEDAMPLGQEFYRVDENRQLVERYNPEALREAINDERQRRLGADGLFVFQDHAFQFDREARENIQGAHSLARDAIDYNGAVQGDFLWHGASFPFVFIDAENTPVPMDAQTVVAFAQAAGMFKQAVIIAARTLKDMDPIPMDFTDDKYWP